MFRNLNAEMGLHRLAKKIALLPDSKTGQKAIYLNAPALAVLETIPKNPANPFVIAGQKPGSCMTDLKRPWSIICRSAGLTNLRLHDLRHSFASAAIGRGLSLPIIGKLLGHSSPQTTARYAQLADQPIIQANELVGREIARVLDPTNNGPQFKSNIERI